MGSTLISLSWSDWLYLVKSFMIFSAMSMGGPLVLLPEMRRLLVNQQGWLTDEQLSASVVIAQAAPGPNVLFVALLGWNVGMNAGGWGTALFGTAVIMFSILLPSSILIFATARWIHRNQHKPLVKSFKQGLAPLVIALLICSGWSLAASNIESVRDWPLPIVTAAAVALVLWGRIHMVWLIAVGAVLGASGVLSVG